MTTIFITHYHSAVNLCRFSSKECFQPITVTCKRARPYVHIIWPQPTV